MGLAAVGPQTQAPNMGLGTRYGYSAQQGTEATPTGRGQTLNWVRTSGTEFLDPGLFSSGLDEAKAGLLLLFFSGWTEVRHWEPGGSL